MPAKKEYTNGEVTIVWKPELCIHSKNCVNGLPGVFDVDKRPWINAEGASTEEIIAHVANCPSGALTTYRNTEQEVEEPPAPEALACRVMPNGPLLVTGSIKIEMPEGEVVERATRTAFCRCGASKNKPFCDGAHSDIGFVG